MLATTDQIDIVWIDIDNKSYMPLHEEIVFVDGGLAQYRDGIWYSATDTPPLKRPITWPVKHWARIRVPVRSVSEPHGD